METFFKQNAGVDVSKNDFKSCFSIYGPDMLIAVKESRSFKNTEEGFSEFQKWLESKRDRSKDLHVTVEATGVYYEGLACYLTERSYSVHAVLPNQSKNYGKGLGLKSKTDKIDARMLSRTGLNAICVCGNR
ncbi:MAG: transposase [Prevotellaceae bacterium]|jgi:transposase|nr:transposase [Prevotellaceae bacterium]